MVGTRLVGSPLGTRPRLLLLLGRVGGGAAIGAALVLSLPALVALTLLVLGAMADLVSTTAMAVVLVAESPEARATTLTVNQAALSLGVACGGALGGIILAYGDYVAVGLVALAWLLASAWLVWFSQPREAPTLRTAGI